MHDCNINSITMSLSSRRSRKGFTLVELAMSILVIGLLLIAISAASKMIKQAELRSIMKEIEKHQTSYNNFVSFYGAAPGDFDSASDYWTGANNCVDTGNSNCDGDGDGIIDYSTTAMYEESSLAWKHLELAKMTSVQVDPVTSTASIVLGDNVPISKRSSAGYTMVGSDGFNTAPFDLQFDDEGVNALILGAEDTANNVITDAVFTPEEAYNIIRKMDDGRYDSAKYIGAETGGIRASDGRNTTAGDCWDATNGLRISTGIRECVLIFRLD